MFIFISTTFSVILRSPDLWHTNFVCAFILSEKNYYKVGKNFKKGGNFVLVDLKHRLVVFSSVQKTMKFFPTDCDALVRSIWRCSNSFWLTSDLISIKVQDNRIKQNKNDFFLIFKRCF